MSYVLKDEVTKNKTLEKSVEIYYMGSHVFHGLSFLHEYKFSSVYIWQKKKKVIEKE